MSPTIRLPYWSEEYSGMEDQEVLDEFHRLQRDAKNAQELDELQVTRNTYPPIRDQLIELLLEIASRFEAEILSR